MRKYQSPNVSNSKILKKDTNDESNLRKFYKEKKHLEFKFKYKLYLSCFLASISANRFSNALDLSLGECPGFKCPSGVKQCISHRKLCDRKVQCLRAEDEMNCQSQNAFREYHESPHDVYDHHVGYESKQQPQTEKPHPNFNYNQQTFNPSERTQVNFENNPSERPTFNFPIENNPSEKPMYQSGYGRKENNFNPEPYPIFGKIEPLTENPPMNKNFGNAQQNQIENPERNFGGQYGSNYGASQFGSLEDNSNYGNLAPQYGNSESNYGNQFGNNPQGNFRGNNQETEFTSQIFGYGYTLPPELENPYPSLVNKTDDVNKFGSFGF